MYRTTLMLPTDLKAKAAIHARRLGLSLGELVRQLLEREISTPRDTPVADTFWSDARTFAGPGDLAAHHDDHLYDNPDEPRTAIANNLVAEPSAIYVVTNKTSPRKRGKR